MLSLPCSAEERRNFAPKMKRNMKIAIVGSRTFEDYELLQSFIESILTGEELAAVEAVVSGGARGADTLAERFAAERGLRMIIFPAEWKKYGRRAGFIRNVDIIRECDVCFAFWDGESHGTKHDIELCDETGKPCHICYFKQTI